jgi:hypothetical protein
MAMPVLVIAALAVRTRRRAATPLLVTAGTVVAAVLAYNLSIFGSVQGGYAEINRTHPQWHGVAGTWSTRLVGGLLGLLVSPSRGLLVYSPILVVALAGLGRGLRPGRDGILRYTAVAVGASLVTLGAYAVWWGGHSFGPRLLVDVLPALVLGLVPVWDAAWRSRLRRGLLVAAFAVSVLIEGIGAFYYPSPREVDWDWTPADVDWAHERLWDWRDPQLLRLLRNGPAAPGFRTGP